MSQDQSDYSTEAAETVDANIESKPYRIEGRHPTIFRTVKNKDNPYVMIDRRPVDNKKLSFKAKGILTYLMSRPDGWEVSVTDLVNHGTDGEDSIRSGLKELKEAGHMRYVQKRVKGRITQMIIEVYEVPNVSDQPQADFPDVEKPDVEKPDVENPTQVLSNSSSNELSTLDDAQNQKIAEKANKKVDAVLELERKAAGEKTKNWTYREKFSFNQDMLDLADCCAQKFGKPSKRDISLWIMEIGEWVDFGVRKQDWPRAVEIVSGFSAPALSVTGMTKALKRACMERKDGATEKQDMPPQQVEVDAKGFIKSW